MGRSGCGLECDRNAIPAPSGALSDNVNTSPRSAAPAGTATGPDAPALSTHPFQAGGRKTHDQVCRPLSGYDDRRARVRIYARWRECDHSAVGDAREGEGVPDRVQLPKRRVNIKANVLGQKVRIRF